VGPGRCPRAHACAKPGTVVGVDLQERRQLDMAERMHKVRSRARPWRAIFLLVIALAAAGISVRWGASLHHDVSVKAAAADIDTDRLITYVGAGAFFVIGMAAAFALSGQAKSYLQPRVGDAHAGIVRYVVLLVSLFIFLVFTLQLFRVPIGQVLAGGAVIGVLLGIAAQQSLSNLFAGLVLMFARPFRVGDQVRFRSGSLGGAIEGTIVDISITYVRVETTDGSTLVPNAAALSAATVLVRELAPPDA
jgi:small-conductance mechanosensitive channel